MQPDPASEVRKKIFLSSDLPFASDPSGQSSPCCVFHQQGQARPRFLSYSSFGKCLALHREWLKSTITDALRRCGKRNRRTGGDLAASRTGHIDDIVIAYISRNSPDMLLSVLACSSPELNPVVPALLNTRWTPSEMIASLRSTDDQNNRMSTTHHSVTIVLHDDSIASTTMASRVSNGLGRTNNQYTLHLPIPDFSHDFFQSTTDFSDNFGLGSFRENKYQFSHERMKAFIETASSTDALILFTSGTTGGSKGVRLSHRALLVQALTKLDKPCRYSAATSMLATTVPLFHVGGFSSFLAVLLAGGQLIFPEQVGRTSTKFQAQDISQSLRDPYLPANTLVVVPAMLSSFFASEHSKGSDRVRFFQARFILIGGQSASQSILEETRYYFPNARIVQTYACTEAASSMTYLSVTNDDKSTENPAIISTKIHGSCVGSPPTHVKLQIFDWKSPPDPTTEIGKNKPITEPYKLGVIATFGPHVMNGYWKRGKQGYRHAHVDARALKKDNQLFIGSDLGFWDDRGRLCFGGRLKDVVRTGGETVLSREVEQVLLQHPGVAECAIFPRKHDRYGEAVACAVVTKGDDLSLDVVKKWCQGKGLAGYKQPKFLFLVTSLPRNSSGKVLKHKLVSKFGNNVLQSKL